MTTTETPATEAPKPAAKKVPRVNWHEKYDEVQERYDNLLAEQAPLVAAVERLHDEAHDGAFRHCDHPICDAANDLLYDVTVVSA